MSMDQLKHNIIKEKIIRYEGGYWWGDAINVTSVLENELKKIYSKTKVVSIEIGGSDFNDGREYKEIKISVKDKNLIDLKKELKEIFHVTRVDSIIINGSDLTDSKKDKVITISVSNNEITIK